MERRRGLPDAAQRRAHRDLTAQVGVTHLLVDGKENLMDGQPYLTAEGALVMEVNALIPHITGTRTQYDDKVNVLRIETE